MEVLCEYEQQRQENIENNKRLLEQLELLKFPTPSTTPKATNSGPAPKKPKRNAQPIRVSRRLRGEKAELSSIENVHTFAQSVGDQDKLNGDLPLEDVGDVDNVDNFRHMLQNIVSNQQTDSTVTRQESIDILGQMDSLQKLKIQHKDATVKVCKGRIYSACFHPSNEKTLVVVGDREGRIGFWDVSGDAGVFSYRPHRWPVFHIEFAKNNPNILYTVAYDDKIRMIDLSQPADFTLLYEGDDNFSSMTVDPHQNMQMWLGTHAGELVRFDMRTKETDRYELLTSKIGSVDVHPVDKNILALASRNRSSYIYDIRCLKTPVSQYVHDRSVTAAYWSPNGSNIVTISHDNHIRLWKGREFGTPTSIYHNNQTGCWVTMFRPRWKPQSKHPIFACANMNRSIEVFSNSGEKIAIIRDDRLKVIPAVVSWHPTQNMLLGANASGRVSVWS